MLSRLFSAALLFLALNAPLAATAEDDTTYLVDRLMAENFDEEHRSIALAYLHVYEDWLRERSVKVLDEDLFAAAFPHAFTQSRREALGEIVADKCLARFSDSEIHAAAETFVRPRSARQRYRSPWMGLTVSSWPRACAL